MITPARPHRNGAGTRPHRGRIRSALAGLIIATVSVGITVTLPPLAAAIPNTDPYAPPSETVQSPATDGCPQRDQPPPAIDTSEDLPPGSTAPKPLPVPAHPVGGGQLAHCGLIVPKGAPALPSDISAAAWVVADLDTGQILGAKDAHGRYRPASTLKLLTANVMLHNLKNLGLAVKGTSTDADQEGTRVGLEAGGTYTVKQLLTYLLIISGNDAANALARTNGGYDKTVADMNEAAKALGALDTRAATVSGLDGAGQSTSAYDLALFAKADMAMPLFSKLISTQDARVPSATGAGYIAANDNQLLYQYKGALGGKTGFTDDAGNTYVGMAERDGRRLVVTMMGGTQQPRRQWMQAASLLDWGFALPASTPPVGTLVGSLAEATAVPAQPTASTGAPASPTARSVASSALETTGAVLGTPANTSSGLGGIPTAIVLAGIGVLVVVLGVLLLLRRRHLNKRPAAGIETIQTETETEPAQPEAEPSETETEPAQPEAEPSETGSAQTEPAQPEIKPVEVKPADAETAEPGIGTTDTAPAVPERDD